jgi:GTP cyclohydrolase FolE2
MTGRDSPRIWCGIAVPVVGGSRFESFSVVAAENFESIHNQSALAEIVRVQP